MKNKKFVISFRDCECKWNVISDNEPGIIGHMYKFDPIKAVIVTDAYDEEDFHYYKKAKDSIPAGTVITIDCWWMDYLGNYFRVYYNNDTYDINPNCLKIIDYTNNCSKILQ